MYIRRPSKYRNIKTKVDGITFDSQKEANRYRELKFLERAGKIKKLELQPKYKLTDKYKDPYSNKTVKSSYYIADFSYITDKGEKIIEDVKGYKTDVYKLKKKMMYHQYKIAILEI